MHSSHAFQFRQQIRLTQSNQTIRREVIKSYMLSFAHTASFDQEPKMESVHSLSFGTAVLKVLQSKSLPSESNEDEDQLAKEGEGNFEARLKRFCDSDQAAAAPPAAGCPGNGSPGRYTLSKDRRESEILRTIDQEESIRQDIF